MTRESRNLTGQVVLILLNFAVAVVGMSMHANWLVYAATVSWVLSHARWPFVDGPGGLPAPAFCFFGVITVVLSLFYGIGFFPTAQAVVVIMLSLAAYLSAQIYASR